MVDEMHSSCTWELVPLPASNAIVGYYWVCIVKIGPDGTVDRLKARLVAKGYTKIFSLNYSDTFYPIAKIAFVIIFLPMVAIYHWSLH